MGCRSVLELTENHPMLQLVARDYIPLRYDILATVTLSSRRAMPPASYVAIVSFTQSRKINDKIHHATPEDVNAKRHVPGSSCIGKQCVMTCYGRSGN